MYFTPQIKVGLDKNHYITRQNFIIKSCFLHLQEHSQCRKGSRNQLSSNSLFGINITTMSNYRLHVLFTPISQSLERLTTELLC